MEECLVLGCCCRIDASSVSGIGEAREMDNKQQIENGGKRAVRS